METLTAVLEFFKPLGTFMVASVLAAAGGWSSTYANHRIRHINTPHADVPPVCWRTVKENMGMGWFFGISFSVAGLAFGYNSIEVFWMLSCIGGYFNYETVPPVKNALLKMLQKAIDKWPF